MVLRTEKARPHLLEEQLLAASALPSQALGLCHPHRLWQPRMGEMSGVGWGGVYVPGVESLQCEA